MSVVYQLPKEDRTEQLLKEPVANRIQSALRESSLMPLRSISCHSRNGILVLTGHLPNRWLKDVVIGIVAYESQGKMAIVDGLRIGHVFLTGEL